MFASVTESSARSAHLFYLTAAAACWGVGTVVSKQALDHFEPLVLLVIQLLVSSLFLGVVVMTLRQPVASSPALTKLALLGLINPGLAYALALIGLSQINASMSVLIWALEPALIVVLAALFINEHLSGAQALLLLLAITGVLLVVLAPGASGTEFGVVITFAAVLLCAVYTVGTRAMIVDESAQLVTLVQQVAALTFAVVATSAVTFWRHEPIELGGVPATAWVAAVASGLLYYGVAFCFYIAGLKQTTASVAGMFLTLIPVFGVAAAYLTGESFDARQVLGAVVVVSAVAGLVAVSGGPRNPVASAGG